MPRDLATPPAGMRHEARRRCGQAHPGLLVLLGIAGLTLLAWPWLPRPQPALPAVLGADDPLTQVMVAVVAEVDAACARGDAPGLRALVTEAHAQWIEQRLAQAGRRLVAEALQEQRFIVGDLQALQFVHGAGAGDRAVLVYERQSPSLEGGAATRRLLLGLRFQWRGATPLLDTPRSQALEAHEERTSVVKERVQEWLQ